jgi:hypothetical protein
LITASKEKQPIISIKKLVIQKKIYLVITQGPTCTVTMLGRIVNSQGERYLGKISFETLEPECKYDQFTQVREQIDYYINR